MLSHYDSAVAEAQLIHSREDGCLNRSSDGIFFSIFRLTPAGGTSQKSYRMPRLDDVVQATLGCEDTYISQSSFWSYGRKTVNFKQTRSAWVDLDLYNIGREVDPATVNDILRYGESLGIPAPTAVVASGRGCYLKWVFETPVTEQQLLVWQSLQATLTAAYTSLAADIKARDASRVLRLLETRNSKSGRIVRRVDGCGRLYDFGFLCKSVEALRTDLLIEKAQEGQILVSRRLAKKAGKLSERLLEQSSRGDVEALNLYTELRRPVMLEGMSERSLNWARFCDIRELYRQRGGIAVGERDEALFWMLNCLSHADVVHASNWNDEVSELVKAFPARDSFDPLNDGSMGTLLARVKLKEAGIKHKWRGVDVSPLYRPSNDFLIDAFSISPGEMASLSTLISGEEKRRRVDAKNEGRSQRREERIRWRQDIREAFVAVEQDKKSADLVEPIKRINITSLAKYVGVERTRVLRFWNQLKSEQQQPAKTANTPIDKPVPCKPAEPAGEAPIKKDEDLALALVAIKQANLAVHEALKARDEQRQLAFHRQAQSLRDSWARHKLAKLFSAEDDISPTMDSSNQKTGEDMSSKNLAKKLALLDAAQAAEKGEPVVRASRTLRTRSAQDSGIEAAAADINAAIHPSTPDLTPYPTSTATRSLDSKWIAEAVPAQFEGTYFNKESAGLDSTATGLSEAEQFARFGDWNDPGADADPPQPPQNAIRSSVDNPEPASTLQGGILTPRQRLALAVERQKGGPRAERAESANITKQSPAPEPNTKPLEPVQAGPITFERARPDAGSSSTKDQGSRGSLSTSERLRQVSIRATKIPPLQLESKGSSATRRLVPDGPAAPAGYPEVEEWPDEHIPPGSHYSKEAWSEARTDEQGNMFDVMEIQGSQKSMLIQIHKPQVIVSRKIADGKLINCYEDVYPEGIKPNGLNKIMRQIYSDCLLVALDSFPSFPAAAEAKFVNNGVEFRVIRPRVDYTDINRFYRVGAKMAMTTGALDDLENEPEASDEGQITDSPGAPVP